jgi:tRNA-modifying protein YgfZ
MESPLLTEPGAVPATGPDAGVAEHYGDPFAEQRAITSSWGVVDASQRDVVTITGKDRLSWLHSLTTQQLDQLAPGSGAEALILSPQGHVQHHLSLVDDGATTWVHVEAGAGAALVEFLTSMRFMLEVEPAEVTADYAVLALLGPDATADRVPAGAVAAGDAFETNVILERGRLAPEVAALRAAGGTLGGTWAHEALRIAAHRPRLGPDTDHRTIPHEMGWIETAVHLNKGCYRGQETVARVHNLGHPPRRLVLLHLDGSEDRLPEHGAPVRLAASAGAESAGAESAGGGDIGFVGSAARHYELGPIALGLVKRTVPVDAVLLAGGIPAAQEVIVSPEAGGNVKITLRRPRGELMGRGR